MRAAGLWVELWADMRANGTIDDILAVKRDMTPEECSADNAAHAALADTPAYRAAFEALSDQPPTEIFERIEAEEGKEARELAEAGHKIAVAQRRAQRQDQPA